MAGNQGVGGTTCAPRQKKQPHTCPDLPQRIVPHPHQTHPGLTQELPDGQGLGWLNVCKVSFLWLLRVGSMTPLALLAGPASCTLSTIG